MSPQRNNPEKVSAPQGEIWLKTIKTAVKQAGGHGARIEEATRPKGCAAGYLIDLIPNHHQLPHLIKDTITVLNGQVVHVSVWYHPEKPPQPVLQFIQKALKLEDPAADNVQPVSPETPNQQDAADSVGDPDMGDPGAEESELSVVANGSDDFGGGVSSDAESDSDASEKWDKITDLDLRGYETDNSMFSAPATK